MKYEMYVNITIIKIDDWIRLLQISCISKVKDDYHYELSK